MHLSGNHQHSKYEYFHFTFKCNNQDFGVKIQQTNIQLELGAMLEVFTPSQNNPSFQRFEKGAQSIEVEAAFL
jgi:hypothetical protein